MAKQKRRQYDDKFRASIVAMLAASGYPDRKGALHEIAKHVGVPDMTISRWFKAQQNPPPNELVNEKKEELADLFESAARTYLKHAVDPDVVGEVPGQSAMTAAAIAVDKMQLLRGLPTEIVGMLPDVLAALKALGQEPSDVFNRIIQRAAQHNG